MILAGQPHRDGGRVRRPPDAQDVQQPRQRIGQLAGEAEGAGFPGLRREQDSGRLSFQIHRGEVIRDAFQLRARPSSLQHGLQRPCR